MVESHACVVHSSVGVSLVGIRVKGGKIQKLKPRPGETLIYHPWAPRATEATGSFSAAVSQSFRKGAAVVFLELSYLA